MHVSTPSPMCKPLEYVVVTVELCRRAGGLAQHTALDLLLVRRQSRPMYAGKFVRANVAHRANHRRDADRPIALAPWAGWVIAYDVAGYFVGEN